MNSVPLYQRYRRWRTNESKKCTVTINEPKMRIRGKHVQPTPDLKYIAFLGVPYALPPIGRLRFAPPQPLPQKSYCRRPPLYKAYVRSESCLQQKLCDGTPWIGSEDCLYLNVFIPAEPRADVVLLPVLVHFHGGGFERGSGNLADPSLLVSLEKCIVVTMNYRLGLLGFLNMRSDNCCGNAGLKDQVMALKWIQDNIEPFGGDPHNVTIAGHSAGGTSVNLHMISPLSKGLFHKAIVQAGGIYCWWGCGDHVNHVAAKLLERNGRILNNELRHLLVESFKSVSANDFLKLSSRITNHVIQIEPKAMKVYLKPSVEYTHENAFLPDTPENLMLEAEPVPTMAGITKQEGYMFYRAMPSVNPVLWVWDEKEFTKFLKEYLHWSDESIQRFSPKLRATYFPYETMSDTEIKENFATLMTDVYFRRFYDNFKIGNLSKAGRPSLYVYVFDYFFGVPTIRPTTVVRRKAPEHGDDMMYVLGVWKIVQAVNSIRDPETRLQTLRRTARVTRNMRQLWATFCRYDVPVCLSEDIAWRRHTEETPCYLRIGETLSLHDGRLNEWRWRKLNIICGLDKAIASLPRTLNAAEQGVEQD